ncbi:MAG: homocysteine S-methyltransferase family protein, partial [Clostridia bacterium]|nr:homocysteine S-methyltransferase family protein [Clostridia bacterium]
MGFTDCFHSSNHLLMEGALGERLKREYHLRFDGQVAMAKLIYDPAGAAALRELWQGYARIAAAHNLPFMATPPTRRANRERVSL